jgi:hypothetical protein
MTDWTRNDKGEATLEGVLPADLTPGGQIIREMRADGRLAEVARRVVVDRRPGFAFVDAFIFLVAYFAQGRALWGLRGFYEIHREWGGLFASLGDRERMISSTSLSRLLSAADAAGSAPSLRWLLLHGAGALPLLREAALRTRDARGEGWHVFDFDPSRRAFRKRALPEGGDLPQGERRLRHLAAPGFAGRKRGELASTESMVQHAGSGLWLGVTVEPGNGDARRHFAAGVEAVVETCEALAFPRARAILRTDGAFGGTPSLAAARRAGIAYLSRSAHYEFLDRPEVRRRLDQASWERVPDSGSGPVRYAAELGWMDVCPDGGHASVDDKEAAPFRARVVASRCVATGGSGHQMGDEKFELFVALRLDQEAWPAAPLVELYYGRIGQENRFAQLDSELVADTTWSATPGGQQLALACAMFVWNARVVAGTRLAPPLPPPPPQEPSAPVEARSFPLVAAFAAAELGEPGAAGAPTVPVPPAVGDVPDGPPLDGADGGPALDRAVAEVAAVGDVPDGPPLDGADGGLALDRALAEVADALGRRPGWRWEPETLTLVAADGVRLPLSGVEPRKLRFYADARSRQASLSVSAATAAALLTAQRARARHERPVRNGTLHLADPSDPPVRGWATAWPTFLPAAARHAADRAFRAADLIVRLHLPAIVGEQRHPLVDSRPRLERHRRWTRERRVALNASRPGALHQVDVRPRPQGPRRWGPQNTP